MLFRHRRLVRVIACFFLLETLLTVFAPSITWAVSGPGQPEFTSYESPGSTDMVNMTTGDMTYNLPVLDIPGPDRGLSLPLTYRAGIRLEQEASWVGLGWSLNPGAIARSLNGYPDDVSNQPYNTTFKKNIARGWYGGIPGVLDLGWDSETGHSGTVDLIGLASVSWAGGRFKSADLIGVKYTKGEGISMDPVRMAMGVATIATAGASATLSVGASMALQAGGAIAAGAAMSLIGRAKGTNEFNQATVRKDKGLFHTNYWVYYDMNTNEYMYGSLYFRDMSKSTVADNNWPTVYKDVLHGSSYRAPLFNRNRGSNENQWAETSADIHQPASAGDYSYYGASMRPVSIAHDQFSVMGGDVSGSLRPQLMEVGSIAMPKRSTGQHDKYSVVPFLDDYKIPFRYEGSLSNVYDYHRYTPGTNMDAIGIDHSVNDQAIILKDPRLMALNDASTRTAPARKGIRNATINNSAARTRGLDQGKNVTWYTNSEIGSGNVPKLLKSDWEVDQQLSSYRLTLPGKGIGAFAVTAEDGTTYHYSLPVYHLGTYSETKELTTASDQGKGSTTMGQAEKVYATTWALTAITSADYVDRGKPGVVDDADWGGWVTFSYGRFGQRHKWRQPYIGANLQTQGFNNTSEVFSEGAKETYYLNAIHTRTHTALFVKSVRNDARGYFGSNHLQLPEDGPASSLRLDEIVLLNNTDWGKLQTVDGIRKDGDTGGSIPALLVNANGNASSWDSNELRGGDTYAYVLDGHDLDVDARIRAFVNDRAIKRVKFNFSYNLCANTPSSFASAASPPAMDEAHMYQNRTGKLTLESVSIYGPASTKIVPDYKFTYGFNPAYSKHLWDGFGMYNSAAQASPQITAHAVSTNYQQASHDGAAWSLTEILDPLGGRTRLEYERDQYAHVSEIPLGNISLSNGDNSDVLYVSKPISSVIEYLPVNVPLQLSGTVTYRKKCTERNHSGMDPNECVQEDSYPECGVRFNQTVTILSRDLQNNTITIDQPTKNVGTCMPVDPPPNPDCGSATCEPSVTDAGTILGIAIPENHNGGDIRVASVTTLDELENANQVRYCYTVAGLPIISNSSGVMSKEPDMVDHEKRVFENWYDYPATPVMYSKVTVLRGAFKTGADTDHDVREEYTFFTPNSGMIERNADFNKYGRDYSSLNFGNGRLIERMDNRWVVNTGMIGQAASIKRFNRRGEQEFATTFNYSTQVPNSDGITGQGRFTEGVMTNEFLDNFVYRLNRSTKEYVPTVMTSSTTVANGMRVDNFNDLYDFFTGQVVESHSKNSLGQEFVNRTTLAYTIPAYASMGLKSADDNNANMLTQAASMYTFKRGAGNSLSLLSAGVQTWNNSWTYRELNFTNGHYEDVAAPKAVWRMHQSYVWNGAQLNADGTKAGFVDFNWSNITPAGQNANWLRTSEMTMYNQYSQPLESRDMNGRYAASKMGNNHTVTMATAQNARYTEFAYSGAEDQLRHVEGSLWVNNFGGEVLDGNRRSTTYAHTGIYSYPAGPGQSSFTYYARVGADVATNRKYRLSAWVRGDANANTQAALAGAKLYASLNGTTFAVTSAASASTKKAGDWYLLNLNFDLTNADAGKYLYVGCQNTGSVNTFFDDFRFQPLVSSVSAFNYDPHTGQTTHVLDNDNLFTRYEYDKAGKIVRVYRETMDRPGDITPAGGRKIKEYAYHYARGQTYTVKANAEGSAQVSSSLPDGLTNQVEVGGEVTYTATPNSCEWYFAGVKVNTLPASTGSLADGTVVTLLTNGCRLSNVHGPYTVTLTFNQHPANGTKVYSQCEFCTATGLYTGREFYGIADGCGGVTHLSGMSPSCLAMNKGGSTTSLSTQCPDTPSDKKGKRITTPSSLRSNLR